MDRHDPAAGGLRERKKLRTRQLISDTATALFVERGFDAVTVADVARVAEVATKTVFNYFPTKESLVLDQEQEWASTTARALEQAAPGAALAGAVADAIAGQLERLLADTASGPTAEPTVARGVFDLIARTPSLRAAVAEMADRVGQVTGEALARRTGLAAGDPRTQIAATAIVGLWRVQFRSLAVHAAAPVSRDVLLGRVVADVRAAATVVDRGLDALTGPTEP